MAQQSTEIEYVAVKAEDIMAERRGLYDAFNKSIVVGIVAVAALLIGIYVFWG
ncbi:MAG: preprotein translocase subunit SecE [Acetobacteraceae bacterium]|nr:preprotein translocase subunit SecE [Acetobacteraceae bacterium]